MQIQRISLNQIKCTIDREELAGRGIAMSELGYGSEKTKALFEEMMRQAEHDLGFSAEDHPLVIEAIPASGDKLVVLITRTDDPEEIDTRFSRFSPDTGEEAGFDGLDGYDYPKQEGLFKPQAFQNERRPAENAPADAAGLPSCPFYEPLPGTDAAPAAPAPTRAPETCVFSFRDLAQATNAASTLSEYSVMSNSLYRDPETERYYLLVLEDQASPDMFGRLCNHLTEFSNAEISIPPAAAHIREHMECLIKDRALAVLASL